MAGPIIFPYGGYPTTDFGEPIWSDALQDWAVPGYAAAQPVLQELGDYAADARRQARDRAGRPLGDGRAQHGRSGAGLPRRRRQRAGRRLHRQRARAARRRRAGRVRGAGRSARAQRVHSVHISAPDRGALRDSWIPWHAFLDPILPVYDGPLLVEVFNAIPPFLDSLRLTRRKFWIPGEDDAGRRRPRRLHRRRRGARDRPRAAGSRTSNPDGRSTMTDTAAGARLGRATVPHSALSQQRRQLLPGRVRPRRDGRQPRAADAISPASGRAPASA